jgi:hypothetical protein
VRLTLRPDFDVTPEGSAEETASIALGQVLDRQRMAAGPLRVPLDSLNRHVFVCGATGGGKSQTVRGLLEAASRAGVPWLVVEPAKAEYRLMAARLAGSGAEVVRIRPGEADSVAAGLNPLEPAGDGHGRRFPLQTHADLVRALFLAAFQSEEPFPQVLSAALTRVYEEAGWDLALGEPLTPGVAPGYPGLADLQRAAEQVVRGIGYGPETSADVLGFIRVRLSSLRHGTTGRFLDGGHPIDFARLLRRNVVLEIEDVGDDRDKAFLMGTVLLRLVEHLRLEGRGGSWGAGSGPGSGVRGPASGLRHLTVFEEAHRLLRRAEGRDGVAAHAVEVFAGLLAEIRAYGEGIVIAEQIPARLIPDVIKNTAVKIVHRLPAADDRDAVGATMNLSPAQSRYLVTLVPGEAAVAADGMDHPLLARMPDGRPPPGRRSRPPGGTRSRCHPSRRTPGQPGHRRLGAQRDLRCRVRGQPVHAAGHARGPADRRTSPGRRPVGRAVRARAPDRVADADPGHFPAQPGPGPARPAAGLRAVARGGRGRGGPGPADQRPGRRPGPGLPRGHGDAGPGDAGDVAVPGAGADVAGPGAPHGPGGHHARLAW